MAEENKSCAFRTSIGGQALIEGILMRGPEKQAIVVRRPDGGIEKRLDPLPARKATLCRGHPAYGASAICTFWWWQTSVL